jgi:large subunit ribosomal protein L3
MGIGLLGQKVGCTQLFKESGEVIPVTVIQVGPCHITQLRNIAKDGYEAVQIGFKDKKRQRSTKSERGHVAVISSKKNKEKTEKKIEIAPKANCEPKKFVREFRIPTEGFTIGQELTVDIFNEVLSVDVTAISKGSGYSGVMKRHNFAGQRATHGVKKCHRHLGSTGCSAYPSRTQKGKKMAGQYGADQITVRNQKVVLVDKDNNLLVIRGAVPGPNGGFVKIQPTNFLPAPKNNPWRLTKKVVESAAPAAAETTA